LHQAALNIGGKLLLFHALIYLHRFSCGINDYEAVLAFIDVFLPVLLGRGINEIV
jgi:hypothetical protein